MMSFEKTCWSKNSDRKFNTGNYASSIMNSVIEFVPAKKRYVDESKELKSKYKRLVCKKLSNGENCTTGPSTSNDTTLLQTNVTLTKQNSDSDLPPPICNIFPADKVRLTWDGKLKRSTAVGLHNMGNTCFLNSILQVLTNTAPLVNYLLSDEHNIRQCPAATGLCALCLTKGHVQRVFSCSNGSAISPNSIVNRASCIMKSHSGGRQEDAHEFLRYFIDAMHTAALFPYKDQKLDLFTKETSEISRIFGGYHKNEIVCNNCHSSSVTYDPFLDLSVEIKQSNSLESALAHYTSAETLASDNAYLCPKCKRRVSARKMFTIFQPPNVLTIQLKRFDHFGKIDRFVAYPERLNLRPYMSEKQGPPVNYKLYATIVHVGRTTHSGHYFAFVKNPCDQWHLMDDSRVSSVPPSNALRTSSAYLLFYLRQPTLVASVRPQAKQETGFIGPQKPPPVSSPITETCAADDQLTQTAFKPAFADRAVITRSVASIPSLASMSMSKSAIGQSPLKKLTSVTTNGNRFVQLSGPVRVHPVKFRFNPIAKKPDDTKTNGVQRTEITNGTTTVKSSPLILKTQPANPIQDSKVSSSTKLVPYDVDDDDDEEGGDGNGK